MEIWLNPACSKCRTDRLAALVGRDPESLAHVIDAEA